MLKVEKKEFESQFDVVKQNRYHETLELNDIVRLIEPYIKSDLNQFQQKEIIEKFFNYLCEDATKKTILIAPNNLFSIQVIENHNKKVYKTEVLTNWEGKKYKKVKKDKETMWDNLVKRGGYHREIVGKMNNNYQFYNVNFSDEVVAKAKEAKGEFLNEQINWQTA